MLLFFRMTVFFNKAFQKFVTGDNHNSSTPLPASYPGCVAFAWDRVDYRVSTLVLDVVKETNLKAPVYKATPLHYINLMLGAWRLLEMGRVLEWGLSDRSRYRRLDKNS